MSDAVTAAGLWRFFGDFPALRGVDLHVPAGSCLALLGRNGAGKSTLLRILCGLDKPSRGEARINGEPPRSAHQSLGVLGHGLGLYEELTARENLVLFARLHRAPVGAQLDQWLERVGLGRWANSRVGGFSRGMRQRLAIARVFHHRPQVFLLDEPFTALDDRAIALLQELLREALADGRTVVMSTHQLREALELASDVALVEEGRIAWQGPRTPELAADPSLVYRSRP